MRPGAASPVHVPNHRVVRSGSVTLAHTSWMGARKVRLTTSWLPLAVAASRPVGWLVIGFSPVVDPSCRVGGVRVWCGRHDVDGEPRLSCVLGRAESGD